MYNISGNWLMTPLWPCIWVKYGHMGLFSPSQKAQFWGSYGVSIKQIPTTIALVKSRSVISNE